MLLKDKNTLINSQTSFRLKAVEKAINSFEKTLLILQANRLLYFGLFGGLAAGGILGLFSATETSLLVASLSFVLVSFLGLGFALLPVKWNLSSRVRIIKNKLTQALLKEYGWKKLKYKSDAEPMTLELLKSKLFPYNLTTIEGGDLFEGAITGHPFILSRINAKYQEKAFQSFMTNATIHSSYTGFSGYQLIAKNPFSQKGNLILFSKEAKDYSMDLLEYFKRKKGLKPAEFSDKQFSKLFLGFHTQSFAAHPETLKTIAGVFKAWPHSISLHFTPDLIFVNFWFDGDPWMQENSFRVEEFIQRGGLIISNLLMLADILSNSPKSHTN